MSETTKAVGKKVALRMAGTLTESLHQSARGAGWPEEAVNAVCVKEKNGDLEIYVDPDKSELVDRFEYGTERLAPTAVIRKFSAKIPSMIQNAVLDEVSNNMEALLEEI